MPGYRPTPLTEIPELAAELSVAAVLIKDESARLGLPAFKILGASWAVNCALSQRSGFDTPAANLTELGERAGAITLVTATDGNHGRALARVAALLGLPARIFLPAGTSRDTIDAIASEGAKVVQTDLIYDEVVWAAASSTAGHRNDLLVQDTAWRGYEQIPRWIADGYGTLFQEIDEQLHGRVADLVAVPTGVGSMLQAALQHYRQPNLKEPPAILAIPKSVNCGSPYSVSRTFPGFTSRCSMPARWAASSAPASLTPMRRVSHQSIAPCRRISASSEPLPWQGMTMYGRPPTVVPT